MISQKRFSVGLIATAIFLTEATMTLFISGMRYCLDSKCTTNNRSIKERCKRFCNNLIRRQIHSC